MSIFRKKDLKNISNNITAKAIAESKNLENEFKEKTAEMYARCSNEEFRAEHAALVEDMKKRHAEISKNAHEAVKRSAEAVERVSALSKEANARGVACVDLAYMKGVLIDKKDPEEWYGKFLNNKLFQKTWAPFDVEKWDPDVEGSGIADHALKSDAWVREEFKRIFEPTGNEDLSDFKKAFRSCEDYILTNPELDPKNPANEILSEIGDTKAIIRQIQDEAMAIVKEAKKFM